MKLTDICYPCLKALIKHAASIATCDDKAREQVEKAGLKVLDLEFSKEKVSIEVATKIHDEIKRVSKNPDPYRNVKDREMIVARELFDQAKSNYDNNLSDMLKLAVIGNSMDFFKPLETIDKSEILGHIEFYLDDTWLLSAKLKKARKILYLADNAGEAYFDLPLIKYLKQYARVIYAVKAQPVQNDITMEEIQRMGLENEIGEIIDTGTATPGIIFSQASAEFIREFESADIIFSKGMANYESISELPRDNRVFYCFKAKCLPVANSIGVPLNSFVAKFGKRGD